MDLQHALALLELQGSDVGSLTAASLRKQYLRLALRTHPDKRPEDPRAAERFQALGAAHAAVLEAVAAGAAAAEERERASALLDLLLRALRGEDVEAQLRGLGEYRPPAAFGVDLTVRFDGRVPPAADDACGSDSDSGGGGGGGGAPDLRAAFREAFLDEGLTEEGDPLGGYELPLGEREV